MSIAMEPTASRLQAAATQHFPAQPCVSTMLLLHLPEVRALLTWQTDGDERLHLLQR